MRRQWLRRARWGALAIGLLSAAALSGCYWDPYTGYVYPYPPPPPYPYGPPPAYPYGPPPGAAPPGGPPAGNPPVQQRPLPPPS
jgi:hypothetical protein